MILCIDTVGVEAGVAVISQKGGGDANFFLPLDPMRSSEGILASIDEALFLACGKRGPLAVKELTGVIIIKGPGSFTGLRVGISVANQFSHQLGIPILGLRADEWWTVRTEEKNFLTLQTMNRDEVYAVGFGSASGISGIVPFSQIGAITVPTLWLGKLSEAHLAALPASFTQITALADAKETWLRLAQGAFNQASKALVEPFYGKAAKITEKKNKN